MPEEDNLYPLVKDPLEGERLNLQHRLLRDAIGNHLARIRNPRAILDVAGGTGIWGREMAREFPRAQVETVDIDLVPLREAMGRLKTDMPGNFHFFGQEDTPEKDGNKGPNILAGLPYPDSQFDYVHSRYLAPFLPLAKWPLVVAEMVRVTRTRGWIETWEGPLATCGAPAYREIVEAIQRLSIQRLGVYNVALHLAGWLCQAGATRITERVFLLGEGADSKALRLQGLIAEDLYQGFRSMGPILCQLGFMRQERYNLCMQALPKAIPQAGIILPVHVVYGQKA